MGSSGEISCDRWNRAAMSLLLLAAVSWPGLAEAATWTVNAEDDVIVGVCDASHCSLREALADALVGDRIVFAFSGPSAPRTIEIDSPLVVSIDSLEIDGFDCTNCGTVLENTQLPSAGFDSNLGLTITVAPTATWAAEVFDVTADGVTLRGLNVRGSPDVGIRIRGADAVVEGCYVGTDRDGLAASTPNAGVGISVENADGVTIGPYNIISGNGSHGIEISGQDSDNAAIEGNMMGTDTSAATAVPNAGSGIRVVGDLNGVDDLTIGGPTADQANVISGNTGNGLLFEDIVDGGVVEGNLVGVTGSGDAPLGNGENGVLLLGSVGGGFEPEDVTFEANVLSGNTEAGVRIEAAKNCSFLGNAIGTDSTGAVDLGNGGDGLYLVTTTAHDTKLHEVGSSAPAEANSIAFNGGDGIRMHVDGAYEVKENRIGINSIHSNGGIGIDLEATSSGDGPSLPDTTCTANNNLWGNRGIARAVVADAFYQAGTLTVSGTACMDNAIDVYLADDDPTGYGEPMTWLGSTTADASGAWSANLAVAGLLDGAPITALQTDADDETSEAAQNLALFSCDADLDGHDSTDPLCGGDDCDDADPTIHPGATESCDAIDSDCDLSLVDDFADTDLDLDPDCTDLNDDNDAYIDTADCGPHDATIYPGAPELCDGIDSDCDTDMVDEFADTDGDLDPDCTDLDDDGDGDPDDTDCAPLDSTIYTGAVEYCDTIDSDCDLSLVDEFPDTDGDFDPDCTDLDDDGDGDPDDTDCDDLDAAIYSGAVEYCDAIDSDCDLSLADEFADTDGDLDPDCTDLDDDGDGDPDATDCNDLVSTIYTGAGELCDAVDQDCDGTIDEGFDADGDGVTTCGVDGQFSTADDDCDDSDASVYYGAIELCDSIDNNCDGIVDEEDDADGDGFTNCDGDCDDGDPELHPGASEGCDGLDTDCDGVLPTDELDADSDGYRPCNGDCDDAEPTAWPGAPELCDGLDNDCDGATPADEIDADGDGSLACLDCDDADAAVYPSAPELCDTLDNDCDGAVPADETDDDGDGHTECKDGDCDDTEADTYIGATEICGDDRDNDCDGVDWNGIDDDGDGYHECDGDCDDTDADIGPDAQEICEDEIDQDCDGSDIVDHDEDGWLDEACGGEDCDDDDDTIHPDAVDECFDGLDNDCDGVEIDDIDEDGDGWSPDCDDDCDDSDSAVHPEAEEVCNDLDDDCDGQTDEGFPDGCDEECPSPDADGDGWLSLDCDGLDCDDEDPDRHPGATELCNSLDDDCDGALPPFEADADGDGVPACDGDCDDEDPAVSPEAEEICGDGVDQDCDASEDAEWDDPECWEVGGCSVTGRGAPLTGLLLALGLGALLLRRRRALPVVAFALCLTLPTLAQAGSEDEAHRQIEFARGELQKGEPDRALKSAESALRLCPTCYDAMVIKALAYEALDNVKLAESLLLAYVELVGASLASEEATSNLVRIQASLAEPPPDRAGRKVRARPEAEGKVTPVQITDLDPDVYRQRVEEALRAGRCQAARSAASELTIAEPNNAEGWQFAGDAARCSGDLRGAVLAYRRYRTKGGTDPAVIRMIDALAENLGAVEVTLRLAEGSGVPILKLSVAGLELSPTSSGPNRLRFDDIPVGEPVRLVVSGHGLKEEQHDLEPLVPGRTDTLEITPMWIGLGTVEVAAHEADLCRTTLVTPAGEVEARAGAQVEVTAGPTWAWVENENGSTGLLLMVEPGARVALDPREHLPASLTVVDLPAGAEVRVFIEAHDGSPIEQTLTLAPDQGQIDEQTGVRLAPPTTFQSLRGGRGGLFASHPLLGEAPLTLVLADGSVNGATYPWRQLDGVPRVQAAFDQWKTRDRLARTGQARTAAIAVVSGILAGAGAALIAGSAAQQAPLVQARQDAITATAGSTDQDALTQAQQHYRAADRLHTGLIAGGAVGFGLAGAGLVVTIVSGGSARKARLQAGPWDPAAIE